MAGLLQADCGQWVSVKKHATNCTNFTKKSISEIRAIRGGLFFLDIAFGLEQFRNEDAAAGCSADCVV